MNEKKSETDWTNVHLRKSQTEIYRTEDEQRKKEIGYVVRKREDIESQWRLIKWTREQCPN